MASRSDLRNRIGAAEADDLCSLQTGEWFAQRAAGKNVFEAERFERVQQNDIQIAAESPVLKSIIQQQQLRVEFTNRLLSRRHAVAVLNMRHVRQRLSKLQRFVVVLAIGGAVTAADDRHAQARVLKSLSEPLHHRRLAGSAEREIADGDDRHVDVVNFRGAAIVAPIANRHGDVYGTSATRSTPRASVASRPFRRPLTRSRNSLGRSMSNSQSLAW